MKMIVGRKDIGLWNEKKIIKINNFNYVHYY